MFVPAVASEAASEAVKYKDVVQKYPGFFSLVIYAVVCAVIGYFLGDLAVGSRHRTTERQRALRSIGSVFGIFIGFWLAYLVPLDVLYVKGGALVFGLVAVFIGLFLYRSLSSGLLVNNKPWSIVVSFVVGVLIYAILENVGGASAGEDVHFWGLLTPVISLGVIFLILAFLKSSFAQQLGLIQPTTTQQPPQQPQTPLPPGAVPAAPGAQPPPGHAAVNVLVQTPQQQAAAQTIQQIQAQLQNVQQNLNNANNAITGLARQLGIQI